MSNPVEVLQTDATSGLPVAQKSSARGGHSNLRDSLGNEITPAFSPGTSFADFSATNSSQNQTLGTATSVRIQGWVTGDSGIRIAFVNSGAGTASATADMKINCRASIGPQYFTVPANTGYLAYIRDASESSNIAFHVTIG